MSTTKQGLLGILLLSFCASAWADVMESAKMLPNDMMLMVSVESVDGLRAAAEKTSLYSLYKDPAMQDLVTGSEKKIREAIETALKGFWQEMQIENPLEQIPIPEGRLILGISLFKPPIVVDANAEESRGDAPGIRFTVLAYMGSRAGQAQEMIRSLTTSATNSGGAVEKKDIGGLELNVIVPEEDSDDPTLYYGMKDNWLVVVGDTTKDPTFAESVVKRMGRSMPGSLAEKPGFQTAAKTLGDSQFFVFVNADAIRSLAANLVPDKAKVDRIIKGLGLQNVTGVSTSVQIAAQKNQEFVYRTLIGVDGPKTGIPALLGEASGPLKLNSRLLPRDAVGFLCANFEPTKVFDAIGKMAQNIAFLDINMLVQAGMGATAGEGGEPPVQFRDDVLAQTGAPLLFTWKMETPYTFNSMTNFVVALSVKDAARLDGSLGRIHQAFLGSLPESKRELLDHTLYLLPSGGSAMPSQGEETESGDSTVAVAGAQPKAMAFSVAGDTLAFGWVDEVEQAIRNQQAEPQDSLLTDPMFRYAKDSLPSQACLFAYQNNRLNNEVTWTALKQLAQDLAKQGENASEQDLESWNPMMAMMQKIKAYVDLSKLPDFKAVEKYWGPSVGYMQSRPEGLYSESITLRPQQQ